MTQQSQQIYWYKVNPDQFFNKKEIIVRKQKGTKTVITRIGNQYRFYIDGKLEDVSYGHEGFEILLTKYQEHLKTKQLSNPKYWENKLYDIGFIEPFIHIIDDGVYVNYEGLRFTPKSKELITGGIRIEYHDIIKKLFVSAICDNNMVIIEFDFLKNYSDLITNQVFLEITAMVAKNLEDFNQKIIENINLMLEA